MSVVIPVYNERESLRPLHEELKAVLEAHGAPYEITFVDDGSRDGSHDVLARIRATDPCVRVIRLRRNFGQTAAFAAGFDASRGEWIVTMDADLQNDPHDIPRLLEEGAAGNDVVSGWRRTREDAFLTRRLPSIVANRLISAVTGVRLHDYGCSLKVYHRDVIAGLRLYGEMHRFLPALASRTGASVRELVVHHRARKYGRSKYGLSRVVAVLLDLMTVRFLLSYDTRPIHVFGSVGLAASTAGAACGAYLTFVKLHAHRDIGERPLLALSVLLVLFGTQLIMTGLLAELLTRTYYEAQNKKTYVVRETLEALAARTG